MYSVDKQQLEQQNKQIEVDIHPISKWKRTLLYLGDMMICFMMSVFILNVLIMPITSAFVKTDSKRRSEYVQHREDILYEYKLLHYKSEDDKNYPKYDFQSNLVYSYHLFLAYYCFDEGDPALDPTNYPEYKHVQEYENIYHYYKEIRSDYATYIDLFKGHEAQYGYFTYVDNGGGEEIPTLKDDIKAELIPFFDPSDKLGKTGAKYFEKLSDLYSALFGCVIRNIKINDLISIDGYSFIECQKVIDRITNKYNLTVAICCIITYMISWFLVHILYPLINSSGHTPTMSIMKVERLGMNNLYPLSKGEVALTAVYSILFDLPYILFISLSYTSSILSLSLPLLPFLSLVALFMLMVSLFVMLFNGFDRTLSDLLSQSVLVSSDEVDGIIKAKETIQEIETAERRAKNEQ